MKSKIMKRAWKIAKTAAENFGGSSKLYIAESMKIAWSENRLPSYDEWLNEQDEYKPEIADSSLIDAAEKILENSRKNDCYYMEEDIY